MLLKCLWLYFVCVYAKKFIIIIVFTNVFKGYVTESCVWYTPIPISTNVHIHIFMHVEEGGQCEIYSAIALHLKFWDWISEHDSCQFN